MPTDPPNSNTQLHRISLNLGPRSYNVLVGSVANTAGDHIRKALPTATSAALIFDPILPTHYTDAIAKTLREHNFNVHLIEPFLRVHTGRVSETPQTFDRPKWESCEKYKTLDAVHSLLTQLADKNLSRTDPIISLGGGILSDLAGFAAAIYRRGIPWINIPTTLLSMVDASVGGKTGANLHTSNALLKNMVGAFHQPKLVLIDPAFLLTLPKRELAAGFAECIKHAMIAGTSTPSLRDDRIPTHTQTPTTFNSSTTASNAPPTQSKTTLSFESVLAALKALHSLSSTNQQALTTLSTFIHANVSLKARIVEQDEFETNDANSRDNSGGRMLLNLGHTFAHALESVAHDVTNPLNPTSPINHGEAVALGLIAASSTAAAMNLIPKSQITTLKSLLQHVPLPTQIQSLPDNARMIQLMHADKKTLGKTLRVILPTSDSTAAVFSNPPTKALDAGWNVIRG